MSWPVQCSHLLGTRSHKDRYNHRAPVEANARPSLSSAKCFRLIPSPLDECSSHWALARPYRHANGGSFTQRLIAASRQRSILSYTSAIREFETAGRKIIGSAPVGCDGTADWLRAIGETFGIARTSVDRVIDATLLGIRTALQAMPIEGRITISGYEGSELLVARLLVESGADVRYVGTACPRTQWSEADRQWLKCKGSRSHTARRCSKTSLQLMPFRQILQLAQRRLSSMPSRRPSLLSTSPT